MFLLVCSFCPGISFLWEPLAWLTGMSVVFSVFSNVYNLNSTIALYSQLLVMPTYECSIIIGTLLSGGIVMQEFAFYKHQQLLIIMVGTCLAITGIMYKVCMLEADSSRYDEPQSKVSSGVEAI